MPPKSSAGNSPAPSASTVGRRSGRGKANSTDALKGTSSTQTSAATTANDGSSMKNDASTTKSSETPSKPPVDPSNPSPWRHPDELAYIKREDWGKNLTIDYLRQRSFSIPQRDINATVQVFKVTRVDSNGRPEIVTLPRGYRVPLLFIAKFQWDSLKLVMTAQDPDREWNEYRFDIIHLCRLCHHLFNEAVADEKRIKAKGGKGIEKSWRSKMFDRVLTRFWQRWFVSREWSIRGFWQEFGEEEYEEDVLAHDWVRWAYKGHKGFTLTKDEVVYGVSAHEFMSGLSKAPDGTWTWNANSSNSNLAQVASANAVPPSTPATLPSSSPTNNPDAASAHTEKADKPVMPSVIAEAGLKAPKSTVPITPSQSQQQSSATLESSLRTSTTNSSSVQASNSRTTGEKRGREDDNDDRDPKRLRPGSDDNTQPSATQTTTVRKDTPNGVIPPHARPALASTSSTPQHPVPHSVPSRSPSNSTVTRNSSSNAPASSATTSSAQLPQPSSGTPPHNPPPQDSTPHRRPAAIDLRLIAASHKPQSTPSLPRCTLTSPNITSSPTDSLMTGRKILDALLSDPQKIKRLHAIFLLRDLSWFVSTDSPRQQELSGNAVQSSKTSACVLPQIDFPIDGDLNLDDAKDVVAKVCLFLQVHLAHPVYPPSEFSALLERELNALRLDPPCWKKEAGVQTVPEARVLLEKDVDASLPVRVFGDMSSMTVSAVSTTLGTQTDPILHADEDEEDRMEVDRQLSSSGSRTPPSLSSDPTMINIDAPTSSRRSKSSTFVDLSSNALKTELRSTVGEVINSMMSSVADYLERGTGAAGSSQDVSHNSPIVRVLLEEVKSAKEELKRSQQQSQEDMESLASIYRTEIESIRCDIRARDDRYRRDMEVTRQKYHNELQDMKEIVMEVEKDREKLEEESRISASEVLELRKRVSSLEGQMQSRAFSPSGSNYHGWAGGMDISVTRRPSYHPLGHLLSQEDGSSSQHHSGSVSIPSTPIGQDNDRSVGGRDEDDPPPLPIKSQRKFLAVHRLSTSTS